MEPQNTLNTRTDGAKGGVNLLTAAISVFCVFCGSIFLAVERHRHDDLDGTLAGQCASPATFE
jgi:hypothetical protein